MPTNLFLALINTVILLGWSLCLDNKKVSPIGFKIVLFATTYTWCIAMFNRISWFTSIFSLILGGCMVFLYYCYEKYVVSTSAKEAINEFKSADDLYSTEIIYVSTLDVQKEGETEPAYLMLGRTDKGSEIVFYSKDKPHDLARYVITHTTDKIWADIKVEKIE